MDLTNVIITAILTLAAGYLIFRRPVDLSKQLQEDAKLAGQQEQKEKEIFKFKEDMAQEEAKQKDNKDPEKFWDNN